MAEDRDFKRVEVGFSGGQAIVVRIGDDEYDRLRRAVQDGKGWQELDTLDGVVVLDLGEVVFVKREPVEHRIGFSGPPETSE
jgi:hypothetical protein